MDQVCFFYDNGDWKWKKLSLTVETILLAEFGAASVLISMGAILGKCSLFQLFGMCNINVFFYAVNQAICYKIFKVVDVGGGMTIHAFGAYFGVVSSWFYQPKEAIEDKKQLGMSNYLSDLVSMTGTLFLFVYWPSFNGGPAKGAQQMRASMNTYLSLASSVIASLIVSRLTKGRKLEMEIILNASLAGGVVMGANADIIANAGGAMTAGFFAGAVSSLGYAYIGPYLAQKINLHDTCGVHNLHGMPAVMGGIISAIVISRGLTNFGTTNYNYYYFNSAKRTNSEQAGFQLASLALSVCLGMLGGLLSGLLTGNHNWFFDPLPVEHFFDDTWAWDECEIDHRVLYNLQVQRALEVSESKRSHFKHIITNVPNTVEEEQDLDTLNIERGAE